MRFGVVVFPGSYSDRDTYHALGNVLGQDAAYLWHKDRDLTGFDCVVLPGGFSYGDYLRSGAIARFSPIMEAVQEFAANGGLVLGICNGFQVLCEAGLLPGALMRNQHLEFRCSWVGLRVDNPRTRFTSACPSGQVLSVPIAHGDGRYYADQATLSELEEEGRRRLPLLRPGWKHGPGVQPQRLRGQHRGDRQQGRQRPRHDAPPRTRLRGYSRRPGRRLRLPVYLRPVAVVPPSAALPPSLRERLRPYCVRTT